MTAAGFPHSETPGSQPGCRLPGAYRRLQRPSSAPGAKASTVCPKKLGTTKYTTNLLFLRKETGDARVHCAVLKKRTETRPGKNIHPRREPGPLRRNNAPQGACSLRTQQRARPAQPPGRGVPCREAAVLASPGCCPDRIASAPLMRCPF